MRVPSVMRVHCPRCKTHTEHSVSLYKKGRERVLSQGRRRYNRKLTGYGSQPKPEQKKFAKTTKKQSLVLKCKKCGYTLMRYGIRLKKLEIVT
jgi:large subunit ribosomal protein L44e